MRIRTEINNLADDIQAAAPSYAILMDRMTDHSFLERSFFTRQKVITALALVALTAGYFVIRRELERRGMEDLINQLAPYGKSPVDLCSMMNFLPGC